MIVFTLNGDDTMSCSSCKYLDENNKKNGCSGGCKYYCSKIKSYVNGSNNSCKEFQTSYSRTSYICNKIYEEGEEYSDDSISVGGYLFILIILIIILFIFKIFNLA